MERKAVLVFSDGSYVSGNGFGASTEKVGELVFNTSMTGYREALTDPSYAGQVLVFSYPLIGNYGFSESAVESGKIWASGVVVLEACQVPNHYQTQWNFSDYLKKHDIPGISGIDTRQLVQKIRDEGAQPVALKVWDRNPEPDLGKEVKSLREKAARFSYSAEAFVAEVSTLEPITYEGKREGKKVVLVDCGVKKSMIENLTLRNITVVRVPYHASAKQILAFEPDGVMFSNGPGDPSLLKKTVKACKDLFGKKPVFGVCLGHQILAQAMGAKTFKLKFGHRGSNHAVEDLHTGRILITAQNHGFAVKNLPKKSEWMRNCLDGTNEGILTDEAFSVQFHPEAHPGPKDPNGLFDRFKERMG
ncbi:MAG TPA: glutamine-hydrolyzing carbamoyl-phosphate synthase small subunit [Candidatus Norongarragalinales archaeon]|nr:glutamine-hydrolyzing carbamoyl-phosphate synthase small subunit [Candidatus Norongarragalinales archaeon]